VRPEGSKCAVDERTRTDFERQRQEFEELVLPVVRPMIVGDPKDLIISVEGTPCDRCSRDDRRLANHLDYRCSIDYLHIAAGRGVRGIGARVQWRPSPDGHWPWDTFTIRVTRQKGSRTELEKLQHALANPGWFCPSLHVHAYTTDGVLNSVAVVHTVDLVTFATDNGLFEQDRLRYSGNSFFAHVPWTALAKAGKRIRTWPDRLRPPRKERQATRPGVWDAETDERTDLYPESEDDPWHG